MKGNTAARHKLFLSPIFSSPFISFIFLISQAGLSVIHLEQEQEIQFMISLLVKCMKVLLLLDVDWSRVISLNDCTSLNYYSLAFRIKDRSL